ncbi:hypothetical protein SELMODRAFT_417191 [Selaginella moellendorffii]|uniref:Uncharacterized protein n=1 Tax=Selaginella moellendorffii TaxID=88036 RepID=D8S1N8_SELML|nr:hypothetical protein SELMODRAFT_417191 [Selaginella moellendorffii]
MDVPSEWIIVVYGCHPQVLAKMMELASGRDKTVWDIDKFPHIRTEALELVRNLLRWEPKDDSYPTRQETLFVTAWDAMEWMNLFEIFRCLHTSTLQELSSSRALPPLIEESYLRFKELLLLEPDMAPFVELAKMVLVLTDWDNVVGFDSCDKNRKLEKFDAQELVSIPALPLDTALSRCWNVGDIANAALPWIVSKDGKHRILLAMDLDTGEGAALVVAMAVEHFEGQRPQVEVISVVVFTSWTSDTPDSEFINACKSCGQVERVESRRDRVRDVFYHRSRWQKEDADHGDPLHCAAAGEEEVKLARDGFDCLVSYLRSNEEENVHGPFLDNDILYRSAHETVEWFAVALWPGTKVLFVTLPQQRPRQQVKAQIAGIGDLPLWFT